MSVTHAPFRYDLAIIGAGSGGMAAARRAAAAGQRVIIFEDQAIGGTCVNRGCVPKKLLVHASRGADSVNELPGLGWEIRCEGLDWGKLQQSVTTKVTELSGFHARRLEKLGIETVCERARLAGPNSVAVSDRSYDADQILIATGASPVVPKFSGSEHCLVSDDIFKLKELPRSLAIVGGGYIAVEFACMLRRFGVDVTIFERGDRLIAPFDPEIADLLLSSLINQGIGVVLGSNVEEIIQHDADEYSLRGPTAEQDQRFGAVLMAVGRRPNSTSLGLDQVGIATGAKGAIPVDRFGRTSSAAIFAIGDVTETLALTPVAVREGRRVIDVMMQKDSPLPPPVNVPTAAFTTPECAMVGMTEAEAQAANLDYKIRRTTFQPLAALLGEGTDEVFMKALVESETGQMLGFHFFGPHASEASQMGAIALSAGLSEEQLHHTMALHPTTAEEVLGLGRRDEPLHQKEV
ncbi:dihydrolipoyl dehydrogenase family protein [Novosphingopyxis sp.]|uniref:dihydrolipoyl dehydrogenase family protein n=1 Tax=Novosphingopyxis sp. TaxID=2709690 RepID=UPI003B5AD0DC